MIVNNTFKILFTVLLGVSIFVLDISMELGVAGGVPYIVFVLMGIRYRNKRVTILLGIIAISLTIVGLYLSQKGEQELWKAVLNRVYAIIAIIIVSIFVYSQKKILKEKTKISDEKFKKLSNLTFEGILIHNQGVVIDINHSFEKMFGYSREELLDKNIIELIFPKKYHKIIFKSIAENYVKPYEIEGVRRDGSQFPIEIEARELISENNVKHRVVALRDITDRKNVETENRKLSTVVEQSANAIIITDTEGNIEYINSKFTEVTGYTSAEVLGKTPRLFKSGKQGRKFYTHLWRTIKAGETWNGLFHNKTKNGSLYWEQTTISPIKNKEGEIINYLSIREDVNSLKEVEKNLLNSNLKLEEAQKIAQLGYWDLDINKNILNWSDEVYKIFGVNPQKFEATYEGFLSYIHPVAIMVGPCH